MEKEVIENLIRKYLEGRASVDEINQLNNWYDSFEAQSDLYENDSEELQQELAKELSALKLKLGLK